MMFTPKTLSEMSGSPKLSALIIDDEEELCRSHAEIIRSSFPDFQLDIQMASNGRDAVEICRSTSPDLVLMDIRMPEMSGLEALRQIKEVDPRTFVVLITAHANLADAVQAIKDGAYDYLEKPVDPEKLSEIVHQAFEAREMISRLSMSAPILDDDIESDFVGSSHKMKEVYRLIQRLAQVDTPVLIRGESGTGKGLIARAIHLNSPRKHSSFIPINCGYIPDDYVEIEFFGQEFDRNSDENIISTPQRTIGKFQSANGGSLYFEEITELRLDHQAKILRAMTDRNFLPVGSRRHVRTDARIIASTSKNLEKMLEEGRFREDLYYSLNIMPIFIPPLRERTDDIPELATFFLRKFERLHQRPIKTISSEAMICLKRYSWPGNIRELESCIERAVIMETTERILPDSLPDALQNSGLTNRIIIDNISKFNQENIQSKQEQELDNSEPLATQGLAESQGHLLNRTIYEETLDFETFKEQSEKDFIIRALRANQGRINKTVAEANIPKNTLLRKMKKYGIQVRDLIPNENEDVHDMATSARLPSDSEPELY